MERCFFIFSFCLFFSLFQLSSFLRSTNKRRQLLKFAVLVYFLNFVYIKTCQGKRKWNDTFFLQGKGKWIETNERVLHKKRIHTWKIKRKNIKNVRIHTFIPKEENIDDAVALLKDRCYKEKKKNVIYIEKGEDDKNRIIYINDTLNNDVKKIKYLTNFQKNFIYLMERNSNILLHTKTGSGKTTISLYYYILKFIHKCEFVFQEDLERNKFLLNYHYAEKGKKQISISNSSKNYFRANHELKNPFSVKYTEFCNLSEHANLLLEGKGNFKLKKDEHVLILCPSKELCVQICHIILHWVGKNSEHILKLLIDKENENESKNESKNENENENENGRNIHKDMPNHTKEKNENHQQKESYFHYCKNATFMIGTPLCFKSFILKLKKEELEHFLKKIKCIFFDELDKLFPHVNKFSHSLQKKKNMKKKNTHIILESIMHLNRGNIMFVGASSTLNRKLHRNIFRLLCLNKHCGKKRMFLLREKRKVLKKEEKEEDEEENCKDKILLEGKTEKNQIMSIENFDNDGNDHTTNAEPKRIIKVNMPENIAHFYYIVKNESINNKLNDLYNIMKIFQDKKILILIKNGCSLLMVKNFLQSKNVHCLFLHDVLEISLFENNENKKKLSENYNNIKNIKPLRKEIKEKGYLNKFPVIISSYDSIRGFHINNLDVVLLFNKTKNVNEYVHLSGRVARGNKNGCSIILENEKNVNIVENWLNGLGVTLNQFILTEACAKEDQEKGQTEMKKEEERNQKIQLKESNDFHHAKWALLNELTEEDL